jgi:hypothetical protein
MERYFEKFKTISYANTVAKDITQRTTVISGIYNNPTLYYPYDVLQSERPDVIAGRYYGDEYMAWLLYMSNRVIDPYYDWYIDQNTFQTFIAKKYGSLALAMSKIKYYRNNWYSDPNPVISATAYANLDPSNLKYYEPVPIDGQIVDTPREYSRKRVDWSLNTNALASYGVANGSSFATDEVVDVVFNINQKGVGQVAYANTTVVTLQHLSGFINTGTISSSYLYGRESKSNTAFTSATLVANNIPAAESVYWSSVTYYDYENEINERNKSINVLNSTYSTTAAKQLKDLLK